MYKPQLETFIRVADAGSFNKAAAESYITPTAVIKQINLLETDLGVKLFERTHRGLILTKAGISLYNDAKYIMQYCRESLARARNVMQQEANVIRIGTSPMTPLYRIEQLLPMIQKKCPDCKFQLVPFENTPQNAREILSNMGQNIDVIAGIFDENWKCAGFELFREPICCAVSISHPLAEKSRLTIQDLYGENLMLIHRGWSRHVDRLRDEIVEHHTKIHVIEFDFFDLGIFNRCENSKDLLMAIGGWANVHPLLKIIPVDWQYNIPFGFIHAPEPSEQVKDFLKAVQEIKENQTF